ncbi:small ribosomal subunit Rsm22 family protein [Streptomyces sp. ACA25]|uniref:small ribosomal subunit Rsm22 family protein n=1 Tax=Streptomyces sp. ACA25 TaxID=3022596 RepID=UPI002306EFC4|nr:small ribosomal subunit Rsm22 family protein [Streptomyces sp. ACA25]MDB1087806.1 small ribosomal subunit Rsm22 family protein [Streptomyces sp. ACA25]
MNSTADELRAALDRLLDGLPPTQVTGTVERLMGHYRGHGTTGSPILRDRADVAAYAAYRMPATFQAVAGALTELADRMPGWSPSGHTDVGGGTGSAVWAAAARWPGQNRPTTVLDWAEPALELGRELAAASGDPALRAAQWCRQAFDDAPELPAADLVTVSYVLGELTGPARSAVVSAAAGAGRAVVLVEPGTPAGYLRIRQARDQLIAGGLTVLAPCPHDDRCPIEVGADWCHFAARVNRSALHRRIKGGSLPYEDEKYSYVAAVRDPGPATPAASRIVRRPQLRKGQVLLDLCEPEEGLRRGTVTKRDREQYRAARDAGWGAPWPPP